MTVDNFLCTLWELCACFLIYILLFTDQKKKMMTVDNYFELVLCRKNFKTVRLFR